MELRNDPRLYSAGAVAFDSSPSVNLYAQIQQRKEAQRLAKEDAFKDYINNLNTKITPAGVRVADLPAFEEMKNKWMEYGLKNKTALQKNDIAAQSEFNRMYQGLLNLTTRSKAEEEKKKPYVEILVDPVKRSKTSSKLITDMQVHDEPIFVKNSSGEWEENRNRKGLDIAENYFNPQLDFDKEFTGWSKGLERGKIYSEKPIKSDPKSGTVTFATEEKFSPEQIKQIALNAINGVGSNQEAYNFYQHKYENIVPGEYERLNKAYQSVFGTQGVKPDGSVYPIMISDGEDMAAAEAIVQAQSMVKRGEELRLDKELANQRAQVVVNMNKGGGATGVVEGNEFDRIPSGLSLPNFNGVIYTKDETAPFTGDWAIMGKDIPLQTRAILKAGGIEVSPSVQYSLDIKDGQIRAIKSKDKKSLIADRIDMLNSQKKWNSEPQKGQQPQFGDRGSGAVPNTPKPQGGMVTVILKDGRKGQIPSDKVAQFLKDNPGAKKQ